MSLERVGGRGTRGLEPARVDGSTLSRAVDARCQTEKRGGGAAVCLLAENSDERRPERTLGKGGDARERALAEGRSSVKD
jgi:hypothetical protein